MGGWDYYAPEFAQKRNILFPMLLVVSLLVLISSEPPSAATTQHHHRSALPSKVARADIPPRYLAAYRAGARSCPGLSWAWLAGIGKVESNHGRARLPGVASGENWAGAGGPMQFLSGTARQYGLRNRYRIEQAAPAAARLLCANGAPRHMWRAVYAYNHSSAYVATVTRWKNRYAKKGG